MGDGASWHLGRAAPLAPHFELLDLCHFAWGGVSRAVLVADAMMPFLVRACKQQAAAQRHSFSQPHESR